MRSDRHRFRNILFAGYLSEKILRGLFTDRLRILTDRRQTEVGTLRDLDTVKADDRDISGTERPASRIASVKPIAE